MNIGNYKHGMTGTRLHDIWCGMTSRCTNPNDKNYHNYGGRGIQVCLAWRDFVVFHDWAIANGYDDTLTLDRKDNNGNYEPDNCRWATNVEQQNNRRYVINIEIDGIIDTFSGWSKRTGIPRTTLKTRYYEQGLRGSKLIAKRWN